MATLEVIEARVSTMENDLRAIRHAINGNGQPGILDRARVYTDERASRLEAVQAAQAEKASRRFETLSNAVNDLKVRLVVIAALGGAGGGFLGSFFGGA